MDSIKPAIKAMKEFSEEVTIELEKFRSSINLPELCRLFKEIKEASDVVDGLMKSIKSVRDELSTKVLPELFEANQLDEIKTANRKFAYSGELYASIKPDMSEKAHEFMRSIGYGPAIKEGIHPQTLNTCLREYTENTGKLPPDDIFNSFIKKTISLRKVR